MIVNLKITDMVRRGTPFNGIETCILHYKDNNENRLVGMFIANNLLVRRKKYRLKCYMSPKYSLNGGNETNTCFFN